MVQCCNDRAIVNKSSLHEDYNVQFGLKLFERLISLKNVGFIAGLLH